MSARAVATPEGLRCPRCRRATITLVANWLSLPEEAPADDCAVVYPALCPCAPGEVVLLSYDYVREQLGRNGWVA